MRRKDGELSKIGKADRQQNVRSARMRSHSRVGSTVDADVVLKEVWQDFIASANYNGGPRTGPAAPTTRTQLMSCVRFLNL